jgi:hypothetical protein
LRDRLSGEVAKLKKEVGRLGGEEGRLDADVRALRKQFEAERNYR